MRWILGSALVLALFAALLFAYQDNPCRSDDECSFFYTGYGEEPCLSCFYSEPEWACIEKEKADAEMDSIIQEYFNGSPPLCERCFESDYDSYSCACENGECIKKRVDLGE